MMFAAIDGRLGAAPWGDDGSAPHRGLGYPASASDGDDSVAATLLWVRKAVELHRQRAPPLHPFSTDKFSEVILGGAPLPTLDEGDEADDDEEDAGADGGGDAMTPRSPASGTRAGPGGAVAFAEGSPVTFASRTGVEGLPIGVLYNGTAVKNALEIRELYGLPPAANECGAALLLDLYSAGFVDAYGDDTDQPATALSCLQASFSFVLLDAGARCLLAARSGPDAPPLAWGSAPDGALLFASDADALRGLCDRPAGGAAPFPSSCFYRACDDDTPPQLVGFTRRYAHREVTPVPRLNSSGQLCSLGFYSQSGTDLANMASVGSLLYPSVGWTM